jgi:hypothetical protein
MALTSCIGPFGRLRAGSSLGVVRFAGDSAASGWHRGRRVKIPWGLHGWNPTSRKVREKWGTYRLFSAFTQALKVCFNRPFVLALCQKYTIVAWALSCRSCFLTYRCNRLRAEAEGPPKCTIWIGVSVLASLSGSLN